MYEVAALEYVMSLSAQNILMVHPEQINNAVIMSYIALYDLMLQDLSGFIYYHCLSTHPAMMDSLVFCKYTR